MSLTKRRRKRGVILTFEGLQKLQEAKHKSEFNDNFGKRYTFEELSKLTDLDIHTIRRVLVGKQGVDKRTLERLFNTFKSDLNESYYLVPNPNNRQEWGEAIHVSAFYGRTEELTILEKWLLEDCCRLVTIQGMAGVGKTCLSIKLGQQLQNKFDCIIWQSLQDAPPLDTLLANLLLFLADGHKSEADLPKSVCGKISQLIDYFREQHCLLILDNLESLLQGGTLAGQYCSGYEDYRKLLKRVGQLSHQSCLVLTTREKPKELVSLEGEALPIRTLRLEGFKDEEGRKIFKAKKLNGTKAEFDTIIEKYGGNALALKIVAKTIKDLFDNQISEFVQQKITVYGYIHDLLEQQFERLSELEKSLMRWLVINQEPISLAQLRDDLISPVPQLSLLDTLESLKRRSLIKQNAAYFTLQPFVMEYVRSQFIKQICQEFVTGKFELFRSHALIKASAKDKETQIRLILRPVLAELNTIFKSQIVLEKYLMQIIAKEQETSPLEPGYTAGNIINMFLYLGTDLRGYNFSHLCIWQADLRKLCLHDLNLCHVNLAKSVYSETLGGFHSVAFSPDGNFFAVGDTSSGIRLYLTADEKQLFASREQKNFVWPINFSSSSHLLACGSDDQKIKLWNVTTSQCLATLQGHNGGIRSIALSPDNHILASGGEDTTIKLWNIDTCECFKTLQIQGVQIWSVAFSPDGQMLASGNEDQTVRLWDINTGQCLKTLQEHIDRIQCIAFSPDNHILASGSDDTTIKLWDINIGQCLKTLYGHNDLIRSITFSSDAQIVASCSDDHMIKVWDVNTGKCLKTLHGHSNRVWSVAFSPNGQMLASGSDDQTVKLWNVSTGECLKTLQGNCDGACPPSLVSYIQLGLLYTCQWL